METKVFIDTNILLDFYRIRKSEVSERYLSLIDKHIDNIITSYQIEMEFKKNRQAAILEALLAIKDAKVKSITPPALLTKSEQVRLIANNQKAINKQIKKLEERINRILTSPVQNDKAYQTFQRMFKHQSPLILNRENDERQRIKDLAKKRFILGYPPRKKDDTSIGDAYNWEWIIDVSTKNPSNLIIVSRDSDYGISFDDKYYINDWLAQEYKDRVSQKRKIVLTNKLSVAFKALSETISREMEQEEQDIIDQRKSEILNQNKESLQLKEIVEIATQKI